MFRAPKGKWKTLKKEVLNITELEDSHLINCINLVSRNLEKGHYDLHMRLWEMETEFWVPEDWNGWGQANRPASTKEAEVKLEELLAEKERRGV